MSYQSVLNSIVSLFKGEMGDSLVGVYLHGSMAMGCFNPTRSDIDLLIVVQQKKDIEIYKQIAAKLIQLEDEIQLAKGIELSIVLESMVNDFVYPTPFEFHYSAYHKEKYRDNIDYFCGGYDDADLAAHFVITYHRGVVLFGKPIDAVFKPIHDQYYVQSIVSDVENAVEGIVGNPDYYVLNLSRTLFYLRDSKIASKREGGEWAADELPIEYEDLICQCLAKYNGEVEEIEVEEVLLVNFATYMLTEINDLIRLKQENNLEVSTYENI
ncbi:DUF4111 domain-containing protein [Paenibacillus sp. GSMTC-2017]|uniref:aminoglycoside adenylyltransferase domain-containing protein n=1 Tax=Paenibacillus sp. GSMTC-2017 TaxID=2794350 RepID=UPI0018D7BDAE|nr:aminoglycoside adenylyltransferase domain-containing protein [Paenibacillus sp. GSMTC-2017]MBH5317655.1 DUF4111 domain-containing protein [Paenibacillus sp. GSMTC-2017]